MSTAALGSRCLCSALFLYLGLSVAGAARGATVQVAVAANFTSMLVQVLQRLGLWPRVEARLVYGENIAQTLQFVGTGNVPLGFVAREFIAYLRSPAARAVIAADGYGVPP